MKQRFESIRLIGGQAGGWGMTFGGLDNRTPFSARFDLFLIRQAWDRGMDVEDLADGFGRGLGTMGGDWSGIRDSSETAIGAMLERALNHLFPEARRS